MGLERFFRPKGKSFIHHYQAAHSEIPYCSFSHETRSRLLVLFVDELVRQGIQTIDIHEVVAHEQDWSSKPFERHCKAAPLTYFQIVEGARIYGMPIHRLEWYTIKCNSKPERELAAQLPFKLKDNPVGGEYISTLKKLGWATIDKGELKPLPDADLSIRDIEKGVVQVESEKAAKELAVFKDCVIERHIKNMLSMRHEYRYYKIFNVWERYINQF